LFRSNPDGMPVFEGAVNRYGYRIGAAPFWDTER
jgi:hypothetical protein